jgi:hypothetical protein
MSRRRVRSQSVTESEPEQEVVDPMTELVQVRDDLTRIILMVAPEVEPKVTTQGLVEQIEDIFVSLVPRLGTEEDPLLGYSEVSRLCGRSPQTIRRWVLLDKLMKGERERAGAPMRIRLSTVRQFFAAGSIDLSKYETKKKEIVNDDSEVHGTSPGPG